MTDKQTVASMIIDDLMAQIRELNNALSAKMLIMEQQRDKIKELEARAANAEARIEDAVKILREVCNKHDCPECPKSKECCERKILLKALGYIKPEPAEAVKP